MAGAGPQVSDSDIGGMFLQRPEFVDQFELRVFLHVDFDVSWQRGVEHDTDLFGSGERCTSDIRRGTYSGSSSISTRYAPSTSPTSPSTTATGGNRSYCAMPSLTADTDDVDKLVAVDSESEGAL